MMTHLLEIDALQRWMYQAAGLPSYRLGTKPPKLPRPVLVWEAPVRLTDRNVGRWQYVKKVTQYGKLYVSSLDQLFQYQDVLEKDLEERVQRLPVYDEEGAAGSSVVGHLQQVKLLFDHLDSSLDVQIRIEYEATFSRNRSTAPAPETVVTRVVTTLDSGGGSHE